MDLHVINGTGPDQEKRLIEIKTKMRSICVTMYKIASGKDLVIPVSKKALETFSDELGTLMEERVQLEKPNGLKEIGDEINNMTDLKECIEMPDVLISEVDKIIDSLKEERSDLERHLSG